MQNCAEVISVLGGKSLKNREFSFTFSNGSYLRFQSFEDAEQLQAFLVKNTPVKIDLGAIYSAKVSVIRTDQIYFLAQRKEACKFKVFQTD